MEKVFRFIKKIILMLTSFKKTKKNSDEKKEQTYRFASDSADFSRSVPVFRPLATKPKNWDQIESFGYQLQNFDLSQLRSSPYDLVVIDFESDDGPFTKEQIESLKTGAHPKKVLAYMSIGEAEDYRWYWNKAWKASPPAWLGPENPDWKGNFKVKYWDPEWQKIIYGSQASYLDQIIDAGFDGVYLDIIDGFEYWQAKHAEAEQEMVDFVKKIADYARKAKNKPDFGVFPQNGEELSSHPDYVATVTGIGKEDTWTDGNEPQSQEDIDFVTSHLDVFKKAGKLVLCTDYPTNAKLTLQFKENAKSKGYLSYVGPRDLDKLNEQEQCSKKTFI